MNRIRKVAIKSTIKCNPRKVMRIQVLIVCMLLGASSFARMPSNPYTSFAPNFNNFLPFTEKETAEFKRQGIREITEAYSERINRTGFLHRDYTYQTTTRYTLDSNGRVLKTVTADKNKKGRETVFLSVSYVYNDQGKLVYLHSVTDNYIYVDSLTYDKKGRVLSYYSASNQFEYKMKTWSGFQIESNYRLLSSSENSVVLQDTAAKCIITVDSANEVVKMKGEFVEDSIVVEKIDANTSLKMFWRKDSFSKTYKLGREERFINALLVKTITYQMAYDAIARAELYEYDYQGRLVVKRSNNNNAVILKMYTEQGLPARVLTIYFSEVKSESKFSYLRF